MLALGFDHSRVGSEERLVEPREWPVNLLLQHLSLHPSLQYLGNLKFANVRYWLALVIIHVDKVGTEAGKEHLIA